MFKCEFCGKEFSTEKELNNHLKKEHKTEVFIQKSIKVHGNKYDYSKVDYKHSLKKKVIIICPIHGEFEQIPNDHLHNHGCPKCGKINMQKLLRISSDDFIKKSKEIHNNKYDYSNIKYIDTKTEVSIICPIHGTFNQLPRVHIIGGGCPKCGYKKGWDKEKFIKNANIIHNNFYDYSNVNYVNAKTNVDIICPLHGLFTQLPTHHLSGSGCPKCNQPKLEKQINNFLINNKINYVHDKSYFNWLKNKGKMRLDFYLPDYGLAIECQGEQHFTTLDTSIIFKKFEDIQEIQQRDILKYNLCKNHDIQLIYYFPKRFLKYNIDFYKNKICFHTINDLKNYLDNVKDSKN